MNEPHLDDDQLSGALDNEGDGATRAHLDSCAACRTRFDGFAAVRRAVGAHWEAIPAEVADSAIEAALAAWSAERAGAAVAERKVAATAAGGDGAAARTEPQRAPEATVVPLRRRPRTWVAAVAALVAAVLLAVPILSSTGGRDGGELTAVRPGVEDRAKAGEADLAALDGGDLGPQSDQLALGRILETAVSAPQGAEASPAGSPEPAATRALDDTAGDATSPAAAPAPAPAAGGTVPPTGDRSSTFRSSAPPPCGAVVRESLGRGLGPLVYRASLEWQGAPAVLLAYRLADTSGPGPDHRAFVMALADCRPLVVQGF